MQTEVSETAEHEVASPPEGITDLMNLVKGQPPIKADPEKTETTRAARVVGKADAAKVEALDRALAGMQSRVSALNRQIETARAVWTDDVIAYFANSLDCSLPAYTSAEPEAERARILQTIAITVSERRPWAMNRANKSVGLMWIAVSELISDIVAKRLEFWPLYLMSFKGFEGGEVELATKIDGRYTTTSGKLQALSGNLFQGGLALCRAADETEQRLGRGEVVSAAFSPRLLEEAPYQVDSFGRAIVKSLLDALDALDTKPASITE